MLSAGSADGKWRYCAGKNNRKKKRVFSKVDDDDVVGFRHECAMVCVFWLVRRVLNSFDISSICCCYCRSFPCDWTTFSSLCEEQTNKGENQTRPRVKFEIQSITRPTHLSHHISILSRFSLQRRSYSCPCMCEPWPWKCNSTLKIEQVYDYARLHTPKENAHWQQCRRQVQNSHELSIFFPQQSSSGSDDGWKIPLSSRTMQPTRSKETKNFIIR